MSRRKDDGAKGVRRAYFLNSIKNKVRMMLMRMQVTIGK